MARFSAELPYDLIREVSRLDKSTPQMLEAMTQAGAQVVYNNVVRNMSHSFQHPERLTPYLRITKAYRTLGGKSVNTKVAFYGYYKTNKTFENKQHRKSTESFEYKTGRNHKSTRIGGRKTADYSYKQKGVPVPLICSAREYGTSHGEAKKPFFRKSFKKAEIETAMLKVQEKYIK